MSALCANCGHAHGHKAGWCCQPLGAFHSAGTTGYSFCGCQEFVAPRCGNCRFFGAEICRRRSPLGSDTLAQPIWPRVTHFNWCGEHESGIAKDSVGRDPVWAHGETPKAAGRAERVSHPTENEGSALPPTDSEGEE